MSAWVIGRNMAGCLPDGDTYAYADWDDAWRALRDEMELYADEDDEVTASMLPTDPDEARTQGYRVTDEGIDYGDDEPRMRAHVDALLKDDGPDRFPNEDWNGRVLDGRDRDIIFWLQWEESREPDE